MFKVGDRVIVTGTMGHLILIGSEVTVLEIGDNPSSGLYKVEDKGGLTQWVNECDLRPISPPQKITQNGYEYELVGPVKPEWLVDGSWVVNVHDGEKRLVEEFAPGVFNLKVNDLVSIRYHEGIRDQYRPHTASDWKWGDWAMYRGKRVFVMTGADAYNCVSVSYPDIYPLGANEANRNFLLVKHDELTPTF